MRMGEPEKFARIAQALGVNTHELTLEEAAQAAVREVYQLVKDVQIPSLEEQGVPKEAVSRLAQEAFNDPQTVGNPRDLTVKSYEWIYNRCFEATPLTV